MSQPRFTMVVLMVADLARSVAFYRRLGVEFPPDVDYADGRVVAALGDEHQLALTTSFALDHPGLRDAQRPDGDR